jgi:short-subunit dehydrogenase
MRFKDSAVIITGGSKGIGLSIAKVFARNTQQPIVLLARNRDELEEAKRICESEGADKVDTVVADITDPNLIKDIDFSEYNPGILVNNVGSFLFKNLANTSAEEFNQQFRVNTFGAFNITQKLLPGLKKLDRGFIVNICSEGSLKGLGDSGAYSMAKHALLGFTRSLRKELQSTQIAVSAFNLGQTYSTSWYDVDIAEEKLIDPEDVAKLIIALSKLSPRTVAEEIILTPQGGAVSPM